MTGNPLYATGVAGPAPVFYPPVQPVMGRGIFITASFLNFFQAILYTQPFPEDIQDNSKEEVDIKEIMLDIVFHKLVEDAEVKTREEVKKSNG